MTTTATNAKTGKANSVKMKRGPMSGLLNTRPSRASLGALILAAGLLAIPHAALAASGDKDRAQQAGSAQPDGHPGGEQGAPHSRKAPAADLPTIAITAPGNNTVRIYPAPFAVTASATFPGKADGRNDQRQGVETQFFASGQQFAESENAPYQATFTPPKAGIYTLTAQLRFGEGKRTVLSGPVTVIADVPPTVSLTAPPDNSTVITPANVTITASAASQIGAIARVDFYAASTSNGTTTNTLLGSATTGTAGAYSYTWNNAPVGKYTLTAVATDNWGVSSTSKPITLTVRPGELQPYYIHTDHLDTPRMITDTNGNLVWQWDNQDPFGNNVPNENPSNQGQFSFNLRFPGQYYDTETNLAYNVNRDYDPAIGRYIQSDPIGLGGGVNTYTYVKGNPLWAIDPLGLIVVFTGDPATQAALKNAYDRVGTTQRGSELENMLENSSTVYTITNQQSDDAYYDPNTNTISVDPNFHPPTLVDTGKSCGTQPAPTDAILGHEIGHAATGTLDDGPGNMNNVNQNENPIRQQLGEPPRIAY